MKIAICDDDKEFCKKEKNSIKAVFKNYFEDEDCETDVFNSGDELIKSFDDKKYDMVFLDLELGEKNGFDVAEKIVLINANVIIIFVTSHDNLVYEAFKFRPLGFIVKSHFEKEFSRMMRRIIEKLIDSRQVIQIAGRQFYTDSIISVSSFHRKIYVKSAKGEIALNDTYNKYVELLEQYGFVEACKGVLVNMKYVDNIEDDYLIMYNNDKISISRRKKRDVTLKYENYLFKNRRI